MNLFELAAKITLDSKEFDSGIQSSKKSISEYKKDVMNLAQTYKKQGMNMSDAMKKAYSEIDKSQYKTSETAEKVAKKVTKEWSEVGNKISAKTIAMGQLMADGIKKAGKILFDFGKIGLSYNAQMEEYNTNFKVMLGSTEKAVEKVEQLKVMAAKTPFGMEDLAEATQTLLAFQVPAEHTNKILKMLGDVALGNKEKLKGLALVFGQVSSAGKLQGQDLMQLINQGFNPLNYIAKRTGESMEELRDRMSKGQIGIKEVEQAFKDATSEGGQFYNGMEEASKTTKGLISTLKDVVNTKIGEFFSSVSEKIKEVLPNVIAFVENINVKEITDKLLVMKDIFIDLVPVIAGATAATLAYKAAVAISGIIDALRKATEAQTIAQAALNAVMNANPFVLITTLIIGVTTALITLWNTNEDFRNAVIEIWESIKSAFKVVADWLIDVFTKKLPEAMKTFVDIFKAIPGAWREFVNDLKRAWESFTNWITEKVSNFREIGLNIVDNIRKGIKDAWKKFLKWFNDLWNNFVDGVTNIISNITEIGTKIVENIKQGISDAWDGLKNWFNGLWDGLFGSTKTITVNTQNIGANGSHKNGLDYVPFDDYRAILHKGERVLTAEENKRYSNNQGSGMVINQYIQTVPQTPIEFGNITKSYFEQARWEMNGF